MGIEFNGNVNNNNLFVGKSGEKKEVKQPEAQTVPVAKTPPETKNADVSSLEALGWQNMGLQLSNKNVDETLIAAQRMVKDLVFSGDVDKAKVLNYINVANADRITYQQKVFADTLKELEETNTGKTAEMLFNSQEFNALNKMFGIL